MKDESSVSGTLARGPKESHADFLRSGELFANFLMTLSTDRGDLEYTNAHLTATPRNWKPRRKLDIHPTVDSLIGSGLLVSM